MDPRLGVSIKYTNMIGPESVRPPMKLSYVLMGFYQGVLKMSEKNQFREMTLWLRFENQIGGVIRFTQSFRPHNALGSPFNSSNLTLANNEDSGTVVDSDPRFHWLSIDWKLEGRIIHAIELFNTILDAMISTAIELVYVERSHIDGINSLGNTVLNVHELSILSAPAHYRKLTNALIRESLLLITKHVFQKHRRFVELEFTIIEFKRSIAEGFFMKIGNGQRNETRGTAIAK